METKKKGQDAFSAEMAVLSKARELITSENLTPDEIKAAYVNLCEEYEKLLDEAKFLTKISDKLESKLNATNEKLKQYNAEISQEAEEVKSKNEKILEKNKQLYQEKSELDFKMNKFQLTLTVLLALLVVSVLFIIYYIVFKKPAAGGVPMQ
ncbi:MAG: hypothetical protein NZ108_01440 [Bacteroidia bacterium]|nr:hypothetical protein [Bacteroidia bacterium]